MLRIIILLFVTFVTANTCGLKSLTNEENSNSQAIEWESPKQVPWSVSLQSTTSKEHYCGGVVISDRWILTAVTCCYFKKPENIIVLLGTNDLQNRSKNSFETKIVNIIRHEAFNLETLENNIALLQTEKTIPMNSNINKICLPVEKQIFSGQVIVSGFGVKKLNDDGHNVTFLKSTRINLYDSSDCKSFYKSAFKSGMICAGYASGFEHDKCRSGYAGAPLQRVINGRYYLVGILTFGDICGSKHMPNIAAKV
ncbi:Serase-1B-like protein [Leptotrombidium deliense]|uniref:Serase-1B-like protein n=1 Tax=Leptotrombidium deliense TaxID=299467 RepID=A0A443SDQ1_9ACAR|nr:Serase-1B-like protein [Leptotrombidium deliense]